MSVIDDYLQKVDTLPRQELERIRAIVKQTVPEAEEVISYSMPAFKYKGQYLIAFTAFKNHLSLFPTAEPVEALQEKLGAFVLSKGGIQFTLENPISDDLVKEIVLYRANTILKNETAPGS